MVLCAGCWGVQCLSGASTVFMGLWRSICKTAFAASTRMEPIASLRRSIDDINARLMNTCIVFSLDSIDFGPCHSSIFCTCSTHVLVIFLITVLTFMRNDYRALRHHFSTEMIRLVRVSPAYCGHPGGCGNVLQKVTTILITAKPTHCIQAAVRGQYPAEMAAELSAIFYLRIRN